MSDSSGKDSGFLRKVVKFVSNPNTEWGGLIEPTAPAELSGSGPDRTELQVMIERKRRNDFVRRQELDLLRRIRREGLTGDQIRALQKEQGPDTSGYQPTEQGALPATELRQRIDGIERDMAFEDTVVTTRALPLPLESPRNPAAAATSTVTLKATTPFTLAEEATRPGSLRRLGAQVTLPKVDLQFERMSPAPGPGAVSSLAAWRGTEDSPQPDGNPQDAPSPASGAWLPMMEVTPGPNDAVQDGELDAAAIAFANADFGGCEKMLRALVAPKGLREQHPPTWRALLDLYRAIGQQQRFEWTAASYVKQFGEHTPAWVSIPRLAMHMDEHQAAEPAAQAHAAQGVAQPGAQAGSPGAMELPAWPCPASLDMAAVAKLRVHVSQTTGLAAVDWGAVQLLDAAAADALRILFREWASKPLRMQWKGVGALFDLLEIAAPPGDHVADPGFWYVRMEALRLLGVSGPFDLAAEDFAQTYGIAPPEWVPALAVVAVDGEDLPGALPGRPDFAVSTLPDELGLTSTVTVELVGQLAGDISKTLSQTLHDIGDANTVMVSCARLVRVDLMAAGELLNWVAARRSEGRLVRFTQVHRVIALFFCAMGLDDQAPIELRPL